MLGLALMLDPLAGAQHASRRFCAPMDDVPSASGVPAALFDGAPAASRADTSCSCSLTSSPLP